MRLQHLQNKLHVGSHKRLVEDGELIIDVLPDLVVALVSAIGDALADLPDRIADAIYTAITGREATTRGSIRSSATIATEAASSGDPVLVGAIAAVRAIGDRSRSRSAAAQASP